jgi:outer membrane protein assembly factor BamB
MAEFELSDDERDLLGFAHDATTYSLPTIRRRVEEKRAQWTRDALDVSRRAAAEAKLAQLKVIHQRLQSYEAAHRRHTPDPEAEEQTRRWQAQLDTLFADALAGRGILAPAQRRLIRFEAERLEIPTELLEAALRATPAGEGRVGATPPEMPWRASALDAAEVELLHRELAKLGHASLYALVGLPESAPWHAVQTAAEQRLNLLRLDRAPQHHRLTQCLTACREYFDSENGQAQYDLALFNERVRQFAKCTELILAGGRMEQAQVDHLLTVAAPRLGVPGDAAEQCLRHLLHQQGVLLAMLPTEPQLAAPPAEAAVFKEVLNLADLPATARPGPQATREFPAAAPVAAPTVPIAAAAVPERPPLAPPQRLRWRYAAPAALCRGRAWGCPAVHWNSKIFASFGPRLVVLSPEGRLLAEGDVQASTPAAPVLGADGLVRFHAEDGQLHGLDQDGQVRLAPALVGTPLERALPLTDAHGVTWVCIEGGLTKVDAAGAADGRIAFKSLSLFDCAGVLCGETLYLGVENYGVYALALDGRKPVNRWNVKKQQGFLGATVSAALASDSQQRVIALAQNHWLYALKPSGEVAWKTPLPGRAQGSPVVDGEDRIYVTMNTDEGGGLLWCFESRKEREAWRYSFDATTESTPVLGDDGIAYFGDNAGRVHAVAAGQAAWVDQLDGPIRSAGTLPAPGCVAFLIENHTLAVLECSATALAPGWPKLFGNLENRPVR